MPASLADKTHLYQRIVKVKRALEMKGVRVDVRNGEDGTSPSSCYIYDAEEDEEVHVDEMMPSSVIWDAFGATPTASVAPGASLHINHQPHRSCVCRKNAAMRDNVHRVKFSGTPGLWRLSSSL
mmetsp:Transcript_42155/g.105256  ORF Transcript_42155/g.105256 Transcript_42155/m.105256 type:complete len:124 (+) Transcript_42155:131-502(+)